MNELVSELMQLKTKKKLKIEKKKKRKIREMLSQLFVSSFFISI
jgi:hypothetical protein